MGTDRALTQPAHVTGEGIEAPSGVRLEKCHQALIFQFLSLFDFITMVSGFAVN